jgi:hypothetical protein
MEKQVDFLGTPHWGLNLDRDLYVGDEREQLFFRVEITLQIAAS